MWVAPFYGTMVLLAVCSLSARHSITRRRTAANSKGRETATISGLQYPWLAQSILYAIILARIHPWQAVARSISYFDDSNIKWIFALEVGISWCAACSRFFNFLILLVQGVFMIYFSMAILSLDLPPYPSASIIRCVAFCEVRFDGTAVLYCYLALGVWSQPQRQHHWRPQASDALPFPPYIIWDLLLVSQYWVLASFKGSTEINATFGRRETAEASAFIEVTMMI